MVEVAEALERWHRALRERDEAAVPGLLADEVVFRSPAVHTPQVGRDVVTGYLTAAMRVLGTDAFRYERQWLAEDSAVLEFHTEVGGLAVHGVDMIAWDEAGLIRDFTVMVRPLKGLQVLVEHMGAELLRMLEAAGH